MWVEVWCVAFEFLSLWSNTDSTCTWAQRHHLNMTEGSLYFPQAPLNHYKRWRRFFISPQRGENMNIQRAPVHAIIEGEGVSEEATLDRHNAHLGVCLTVPRWCSWSAPSPSLPPAHFRVFWLATGTWTGTLQLPARLAYCCPGLIALARDSTQDSKSLFTSINLEFFVAILSPVFLANLKMQLLTTGGFIHLSKSGISSCFDVVECGDCLLVSENHLVLLLCTWSRSLGGWYRAMEQNETDRHWSTPGGLAELGRSVQTVHFLLSFPWPLILEELVYMMVRKKAEAQYVWQNTTGESSTGSPRFHLMTSLHPSFVQASGLSEPDRKLWNCWGGGGGYVHARGWVHAKTQIRQFLVASYFTGTKWHWWIMTVRTYFCLTISNTNHHLLCSDSPSGL